MAGVVIALAILFSLFRALTPWAKQYKTEVENHLSTILGKPVTVKNMETSWYWFAPVLKLDDIDVLSHEHTVIRLKKLLVGIDLFRSLISWQIQPGMLYIEDLNLIAKQNGNSWQIDGLTQTGSNVDFDSKSYLPLLSWLLNQQKIVIKNVTLTLHLNDATILPVEKLNIAISNTFGHYKIHGTGKLAQKIPTEISLVGDFQANSNSPVNLNGNMYLIVNNFLLPQWQGLLDNKNIQVLQGKGDGEFWLQVAKGNMQNLQSNLHLQNLSLRKDKKPILVRDLSAKLFWNKTNDGWQFLGNHINIQTKKANWLEKTFKLEYKEESNSYRFFLNKLQIESLLSLNIKLPEYLDTFLKYKPKGELNNFQIGVQNDSIVYFLTHFKNLNWTKSTQYPGVKNLSGILYWEPNEGRLELDSKNTTIIPNKLKPATFSQINGAIDWKLLSQGYRSSIDRFVLVRPDLVMNLYGVIDEINSNEPRINLKGEFSANDAHKWLAYIPSTKKPKLDSWIHNNLKKIDKLTGQFSTFGKLNDFPYDSHEGEFSLTTSFQGVDLIFRKNWPLSKNVDGYLRVNGRDLEINVVNAKIQDVSANKMNIKINEIGLDKETLLFHGKIAQDAAKIKSFVLASPLKNRLKPIENIDILGLVALDLRVEVPLYIDDEIHALGHLEFKDNQVNETNSKLEFKDIHGFLNFDEIGIQNGVINSKLFGDPFDINLQSSLSTPRDLEIILTGSTTIDFLKNSLNLSLPFANGNFNLLGTIKFSDNFNTHINFKTSLLGTAIDMPYPLGKSSSEVTPLNIDVDLKQDVLNKVRFNYDSKVQGLVEFVNSRPVGVISFGKNSFVDDISLQNYNKVDVTGYLEQLNINNWYKVLQSFPKSDVNIFDIIKLSNLKIGKLYIYDQSLNDVSLNGFKLDDNSIGLNIEYKDYIANLNYKENQHSLNARLNHLRLDKELFTHKDESRKLNFQIKPNEMPDLNLIIDDFKFGELDLGELRVVSKRNNDNWLLNSLEIRSPFYYLTVNGDWNKEQNTTNILAKLNMKDLSHTLQKLNITTAVEANTSETQFKVSWAGAMYDFDVSKINGQIQTVVKNGRISNFSPETEEKLGFAKLLSILSLQTIPRRLKLDFSDWSKTGYSFDVYKGNFVINDGIMTTKDSYIDGPVAYASIKGDINLAKQSYDLNLHVAPHITASLPVVATIAGGPVAGIATWVISKIVNQGMEKISGYTYKISGPWTDPIVQQVNIIKSPTTKDPRNSPRFWPSKNYSLQRLK